MLPLKMSVFYLKSFLLIFGMSGFSFFTIETTESFHQLIFRGIKTIYLISTTFPGILCVQDTTLKVLLKVITEHLLLLLESDFSGY